MVKAKEAKGSIKLEIGEAGYIGLYDIGQGYVVYNTGKTIFKNKTELIKEMECFADKCRYNADNLKIAVISFNLKDIGL